MKNRYTILFNVPNTVEGIKLIPSLIPVYSKKALKRIKRKYPKKRYPEFKILSEKFCNKEGDYSERIYCSIVFDMETGKIK